MVSVWLYTNQYTTNLVLFLFTAEYCISLKSLCQKRQMTVLHFTVQSRLDSVWLLMSVKTVWTQCSVIYSQYNDNFLQSPNLISFVFVLRGISKPLCLRKLPQQAFNTTIHKEQHGSRVLQSYLQHFISDSHLRELMKGRMSGLFSHFCYTAR